MQRKRLQIIGVIGLIAATAFGRRNALKERTKLRKLLRSKEASQHSDASTPRGGNVQLAVPAGVSGGNQIVTQWMVEEGDAISEGQILAYLSSY